MTRIKRGIISRAKHKRLLESTKGFRGTKSKLIRVAHESHLHAGQYAYVGRKQKKRVARREWILRIGEASKINGISYSKLVDALKKAQIELDRKILAELVIRDPEAFKSVVEKAKSFAFTPQK
jgi:large subunit ribosomal protein L20